jgi:hypothetical protein
MITKTKLGIGTLVVASFIVGGIAFNAFQADAFGGSRMFGFFRGGEQCDLAGLEKGSEEWQAKMEECKTGREAQMEDWKNMSEEERKAKMEEIKVNIPEKGEWKRGPIHPAGFRGLIGFYDEVTREVVNLDNGIQITITSENSEVVQKLQEAAAKMPNGSK